MLHNGILYICVNLMIVNQTNIPTSKDDGKVLTRARQVCARRYSQCVRRFIIKGNKNYGVMCGGKIKYEKNKTYEKSVQEFYRREFLWL